MIMVFLRYCFPSLRDYIGNLVPRWGKQYRHHSATVNADTHNYESDTPYGCPGLNRGDYGLQWRDSLYQSAH